MFKVFLYIFNYYFEKFSGTGKNYAYYKCEQDCFCKLTIRQPICTIRQPIAVWHIFFHNSYKFGRFLLEQDISDWNRMTDSSVVFRKPITMGKHHLEQDDGLCSTWAALHRQN